MVEAQSGGADTWIRKQFVEAGVGFFHADNLSEIGAQLAQKRVMSRQRLLSVPGYQPTAFFSDEDDKVMGAFGRVFGNIRDFGVLFATCGNSIPNVYGPIAMVFRPQIYEQMTDVVITKESIIKYGRDRDRWRGAAASTEEEVAAIVQQHRRKYKNPQSQKYDDAWVFAELSCAERELGFEHLESLVVEPIRVFGVDLPEFVGGLVGESGVNAKVVARDYARRPEHLAMLQELVAVCEAHPAPVNLAQWKDVPLEQLPPGLQGLGPEKVRRVQLWCRYFTYGTLLPLRQRQSPPMVAAELGYRIGFEGVWLCFARRECWTLTPCGAGA